MSWYKEQEEEKVKGVTQEMGEYLRNEIYKAMDEDEELQKFIDEGLQTRKVTLIELMSEYQHMMNKEQFKLLEQIAKAKNMEQYLGVKKVLAKPMNRLEYNKYRGWELPADENPEDEGMLVEYIDGGKANHPDHEGYISWSPLEVFKNAYKPSGTPLKRMILEEKELLAKIKGLDEEIESIGLVDPDKVYGYELMLLQLQTMNTYRNILSMRIRDLKTTKI